MKLTRWNGMYGLFAIETKKQNTLQFGILNPKNWYFGFDCIYYDGPWLSFGFGPLFTFAWDRSSLGSKMTKFAIWLCKRNGSL